MMLPTFPSLRNSWLKIHPLLPLPQMAHQMEGYIRSMEALLEMLLPKELFEKTTEYTQKESLLKFFEELPILLPSPIAKAPCCFSLALLSFGKHLESLNKFMPEMITKWLIPGKQISLGGNRSLRFRFLPFEDKDFFLQEYFIQIGDEKERALVQKKLPHFLAELKLNILSAYQAGEILSSENLSFEESSFLIQENISSLLEQLPHKEDSIDHLQHFLVHLSAEKKLSEIKENLSHLMDKRPKTFDEGIFEAIHRVSQLFRDKFTLSRDPKHVSRIISFQYLFQKILQKNVQKDPNERYIFIKILKTQLGKETPLPVLGILLLLNLSHETERFEKKHFLQALRFLLEEAQYVKDSFIIDRREDSLLFCYLEIEKQNKKPFSLDELKKLKKELPFECKERIENIMSPIFMPQNEEEILRNIVLLSKQLKYVNDIPQVIISYDKQTKAHLSFVVILVRLLKEDSLAIKELFHYCDTLLHFDHEEIKKVGMLKKRHTKEANIFRISLSKEPFFRKDNSLDLQKARLYVTQKLSKVLGNFRDFNGGMILRQNQALEELKSSLEDGKKRSSFLLENFFYSIKPAIMQSILPASVLKETFLLLLRTTQEKEGIFAIRTKNLTCHFLVCLASSNSSFKAFVASAISSMKVPSIDLTPFSLDVSDTFSLGYIYKTKNREDREKIFNILERSLNQWSSSI